MPTSTTRIANAIMTPTEDGHMPRFVRRSHAALDDIYSWNQPGNLDHAEIRFGTIRGLQP